MPHTTSGRARSTLTAHKSCDGGISVRRGVYAPIIWGSLAVRVRLGAPYRPGANVRARPLADAVTIFSAGPNEECSAMDMIKYATLCAAAVASVTACGAGVSNDAAPTSQSVAPLATSESASPCSSATADVLKSVAQSGFGETVFRAVYRRQGAVLRRLGEGPDLHEGSPQHESPRHRAVPPRRRRLAHSAHTAVGSIAPTRAYPRRLPPNSNASPDSRRNTSTHRDRIDGPWLGHAIESSLTTPPKVVAKPSDATR